MATTHSAKNVSTATDVTIETPSTTTMKVAAVLRIAFGLTFLWAFFDKLFALGYHTGVDDATGAVDRFGPAAWIHGGSPTEGFLLYGADGPFKGFYNDIAGATWADWLFMLGLLGIGLALTFGAGMKIATISGVVLYLLMWSVVLPPDNNPVLDDHIVGALTLILLAGLHAGDTWGLGRWWKNVDFVQKYPVFR